MKNYYDELEVSRNASPEIINRAYKVLAKKYHPDTTTENKQEAEERFKKISEAYETLSDAKRRMEYDNSLEPEITIDDYNKLLEDNKKLSSELINLKSRFDDLTQNNYSNNISSNNNYSGINHTYNPNMNNNYHPNNQNIYNRVNYSRPRNHTSYSFLDIIKFKINRLFRNALAFVLTIALIFIIFTILLYIPYTRNFILNDLHFGIFLDLFK